MNIKFASSVIFVNNVHASRKFYESLLGQTVESDYVECVVFSGGFAIWDREYAINLIFGGNVSENRGNIGELELYFESDDLEKVCSDLEEAGVVWVHRTIEQPWGQRVIRFFDPDRYIVEIGEPLYAVARRLIGQGMTVEEVSSKISTPVEIIKKML